MLQPVIMIGCGGSGQKAVRYVRDSVRRQLEHAGWSGGVPRAWQFIALDTVVAQESPGEIPTIPASDYVSVALNFNNFQDLEGALLTQHPAGSKGYRELIGWRPKASDVVVPLKAGAGKIRAVGRAAGVLSLASVVRPRVQQAFTDCASGGPELERLSRHLQIPVPAGSAVPDPVVVVLGSNAGGTGAGIMLDVIDLVRRTDVKGGFPIAVVFSSDIFGASTSPTMAANGLAFMSELMSAYWDSELSGSELIPSLVATSNRGPHSVFMVGRKNIDGLDLKDSRNVYRAVGEALAGWVTSSQIQTSLNNFVQANWSASAIQNRGGYPFGQEYQTGVVSSFGSATISIGRDRFQEYAQKLLVREAIEFLDSGHIRRASEIFGEQDAKNMTAPAIVAGILRKEREGFFNACLIDERGLQRNQITDIFVGNDVATIEKTKLRQEVGGALRSQSLDAGRWRQVIGTQRDLARRTSQARATQDYNARVGEWAPRIFEHVLRATSEYLARFGIAVTVELVRAAQTELHEVAAQVRQEAREASGIATARKSDADSKVPDTLKGTLEFANTLIESALSLSVSSLMHDWKSDTLDRVAKLMDDLADQVFRPIAGSLQQAQQTVHYMVAGAEGEPPLIESWPLDNDAVPESFAPSPVEFFLEEHTTWPKKLRELLSRSMPAPDHAHPRPMAPVPAARHALIADEFSGSSANTVSRPMIWSAHEYGGKPQWVPGNATSIEVRVSEEQLFERVRDWMLQPASVIELAMREGLREYLDRNDSVGNANVDHVQRLSVFRQKLGEALKQSRPLMELNQPLMARVHPNCPMPSFQPIVQGFPFSEGHPAREIVEQVLGAALAANDSTDGFFSSRNSESVLISSFLKYPVHPMVVKSFTSPVNMALTGIKTQPTMVRGAFWQWAWTKVLVDAIPLPDQIRLAMIRGFAVGRLLGLVTADPSQPIEISETGGQVLSFPPALLTETSADNLLPALLESFVLCFGEVDTRSEAAFGAYRVLFELGNSPGQTFAATGPLMDFIQHGTEPVGRVLDRIRFDQMATADPTLSHADQTRARVDNMVRLLDANLARYSAVAQFSMTGQEHRTMTGAVVPELTMTIQLLDDLLNGYEQVKAAIVRASVGSDV